MSDPVAIVATACEYPGARNPEELWQTALHGRRHFRRIPTERLCLADYAEAHGAPDSIYPIEAGLIDGYRFDRSRFKVPRSTFEGTDLAHWLALDVASRALSALPAGCLDGGQRKDRFAVVVANTLTGEFSRANLLRYRWPFVARRLRAAAGSRWPADEVDALVSGVEADIKRAFPAPDADSLAGGLSNTIAGRIANHFGLRGGAYAADGACASSLVAVATACDRLAGGDVDGVLVCAVDLSLDPFELVGFARNGAMARADMRVFDRDNQGFWPGEGCGCVILARTDVASAAGWPVLGWIRGVGMSTDGQGGLTRPTRSGQLLAQRRAWAHAGLDPATVDYVEAHGTGTPTGDPVELLALADLIGAGRRRRGAVPVGSIKANIGHTKAAAGMAGLLKALAVVRAGVVPMTSGCVNAHPVLSEPGVRVAVRVTHNAEALPGRGALTAGINGFGFGGINCHVVLQGPARERVRSVRLPRNVDGRLPGELFQLAARTRAELADVVVAVGARARTLARSELVDLAASLRPRTQATGAWRACIVADTPQQLEQHGASLLSSLRSGTAMQRKITEDWSWSAPAQRPPVLGFLFPGQGLQAQAQLAPWLARFPAACAALRPLRREPDGDDTAVVQPRLAACAQAALRLLSAFGLVPDAVLGHSFGELSAWHAADVFDAQTFARLARARGNAMQACCAESAMLALECDLPTAQALAVQHALDVACHNSAQRFVLAGPAEAVQRLERACAARAIPAQRLPARRAFHSRLMLQAQREFAGALASLVPGRPRVPVLSTITGDRMVDAPATELLRRQFTEPVLFAQAVRALGPVDLLLELGSALQLGQLVRENGGPQTLSIGLGASTLHPLLASVGAAWVAGAAATTDLLYQGRLLRPCTLHARPSFLASPCGVVDTADDGTAFARPTVVASASAPAQDPEPAEPEQHPGMPADGDDASPIAVLRAVLCTMTELPLEDVAPDARLLADLHLNSIRARQAVALAARQLGIATLPFHAGELANASVAEVAARLAGLRGPDAQPQAHADRPVAGIARWVRTFAHVWRARELAVPAAMRADTKRLRLVDALVPMDPAWQARWAHRLCGDGSAPVLLLLPARGDLRVLQVLHERVRELVGDAPAPGMLVVQRGQLANALLQSVALEHPDLRLVAVQCDPLDATQMAQALAWFDASEHGYAELRLDGTQAWQRALVPVHPTPMAGQWTPGRHDLVLISGGAKGIGAATALWMARRWACRLVLLGRSAAQHPEVAAVLDALQATGSQAHYLQLDLADGAATRAALHAVQRSLGPVRVLVHAAGINQPTPVRELAWPVMQQTWAAKVCSLEHVLAAMDQPLRLLIGYGSVIGVFGLRGEAHYALANAWLVERLCAVAQAEPATRVLPLCWTAWRDTGMAQRLPGVLAQLDDADVDALDTAAALAQLDALLHTSLSGEPLLITGRYGRQPDPLTDLAPLQRHRFLEWPRVWYPGVELVADASVSMDSDPYLRDHAPGGVAVLPLVVAVEAMLSAALCLCPQAAAPVLCDLHVGDAISWIGSESLVLRTMALVQPDGDVRLAVRCSASAFDVDHFSARLQWARGPLRPMVGTQRDADTVGSASRLLYQGVAFHGPVFQRVTGFGALHALCCVFTIDAAPAPRWYAPWQPGAMALGHPAVRDAVLQGLQACVPQHLVLPVGVDRIAPGALAPGTAYQVHARQRAGDGDTHVFDIDVRDRDGQLVEQWAGLRLARVAAVASEPHMWLALEPVLLQVYVERMLHDVAQWRECVVGVASSQRPAEASGLAVQQALGPHARLSHRSDGAPSVDGHRLSLAHAAGLALCVADPAMPIGCDIECDTSALASPDAARLMLGPQRAALAEALAQRDRVAPVLAALVLWSAAECLLKLGRSDWPFALAHVAAPVWCRTGPIWLWRCPNLQLVAGLLRRTDDAAPTAIALARQALDVQARPAPAAGGRETPVAPVGVRA